MAKWIVGGLTGLALVVAGCATPPAPVVAPTVAPAAPPAPSCYLVVMGVVTDREAFRAYSAALPPLYARFGGEYLVVKRGPEALEGAPDFESIVISRWPSCAAAKAFWDSPEYRRLVEMRRDWGRFTVVLAEGLPIPATAAPMAGAPKR